MKKNIILIITIFLIILNIINISIAKDKNTLSINKTYYNLKKYLNKNKSPKIKALVIKKKIENILINKKYSKLHRLLKIIYIKLLNDYFNISDHYYNPHIISNDFMDIIVYDSKNNNFYINNKELYDDNKNTYITFINTNGYEPKPFLTKKLNCKIKNNTNNYLNFHSKNEKYYVYGCKYENNGISYFEQIQPNILMYINAGQDFVGIDFNSIQSKNGN